MRMAKFVHVIDKMSEWLGKIASHIVLILIAVIIFEVTSRYIFNAPTKWAVETGSYLFAAMWLLAGGYAMRHDFHVRVDIVYSRLSPRARAIMDAVTSPLFFLMIGLFIWITWKFALVSVAEMERSASQWSPYVFPKKVLIPVGGSLLIVQGIAKLICNIYMAVHAKELVR